MFADLTNTDNAKKAFTDMFEKHGMNEDAWKEDFNSKPENLSMTFTFDTETTSPGIIISATYEVTNVDIKILDPAIKAAIESGELK